MNNQQYILFYSNNCQHCIRFLNLLESNNVQIFQMACVDTMRQIPSQITSVPLF